MQDMLWIQMQWGTFGFSSPLTTIIPPMLHASFSSGTDTGEPLKGAVSRDSLLASTIEQYVNVCIASLSSVWHERDKG
jgi:hypothetical protein